MVALASFTAGGAKTLYSSADSRWGATGSLLEGDVDLSADSKIARVMVPARNGSLLRLNDDGPLVLRAWFGESGAGADLTVWLQTDAGTTSVRGERRQDGRQQLRELQRAGDGTRDRDGDRRG